MRRVGLGLIRLRFVRLGIAGLGLAGFRLVGLGFGVRLFRLRLAMRLFRLRLGGRRLLVTRRSVFGLRLVMGRLGRGGRRDLLRHHDLGVAILVVGGGHHLEDRARLVAPVFDLRAGVDLDLQQHLVVAAARRRAPDEGGRVLLEPRHVDRAAALEDGRDLAVRDFRLVIDFFAPFEDQAGAILLDRDLQLRLDRPLGRRADGRIDDIRRIVLDRGRHQIDGDERPAGAGVQAHLAVERHLQRAPVGIELDDRDIGVERQLDLIGRQPERPVEADDQDALGDRGVVADRARPFEQDTGIALGGVGRDLDGLRSAARRRRGGLGGGRLGRLSGGGRRGGGRRLLRQ